jgi:hypothetical protein
MCTKTYAHINARTHARARAHTHTRTAWRLVFRHPISGEMIRLVDPVPRDMVDFVVNLAASPFSSEAELSEMIAAVRYYNACQKSPTDAC